jgi:hypothetical protein
MTLKFCGYVDNVTRHTIPLIWESTQDILVFFPCAWCAFQISYGIAYGGGFYKCSLSLCQYCSFSNPKAHRCPLHLFSVLCQVFWRMSGEVSIVTNYQVPHVTCMMNYVECPVFWMCDELLSTCLENIWVEMGWSFLWHQNQVLLTTAKMNPSECRWVDVCCWHCSLQTFRREDCTCMNASVDLTVVSWFWIY